MHKIRINNFVSALRYGAEANVGGRHSRLNNLVIRPLIATFYSILH